MRLSFVIGNKDESNFTWKNNNRELIVYVTNPFKLGFGFKYRFIDKKNTYLGCVDPETGLMDDKIQYNKASMLSYRWTLRHILKCSKPRLFGIIYLVRFNFLIK